MAAAAIGQFRLPPLDVKCPTCKKALAEKVYIIPCDSGDRKVDHYFHYSCIKDWADRSGDCPMCKRDIKILHVTTRTQLPEDVEKDCPICSESMEPFMANQAGADGFIVKAEDDTYYHETCYAEDVETIPLLKGDNIAARLVPGRVQKFAASAFKFNDVIVKADLPPPPPAYQHPVYHQPVYHAPVQPAGPPLFDEECINAMLGLLFVGIVIASFMAFYYNLIVFDLADATLQLFSIPFYVAMAVAVIAAACEN